MKMSVCMAAYNKGWALDRVLGSIRRQSRDVEIVVCDDGSTDTTPDVCARYGVIYRRLDRTGVRNPAAARNEAYRLATGDVWVIQSADVVHVGDTLDCVSKAMSPGSFLIGRVANVRDGVETEVYTSSTRQRPLFFLGAAWASDVLAVGGDSEDFTEPGYDDDWFARCLMDGRKLSVRYVDELAGVHLDHERPPTLRSSLLRMRNVYRRKVANGVFVNPPLR